MIEIMIYKILVVVLTVFSSPVVFSALVLLLSMEYNTLLDYTDIVYQVSILESFPSINIIPLLSRASMHILGSNPFPTLLLILFIGVIFSTYMYFITHKKLQIGASRRLVKTREALKIVYAIALLLCGWNLLNRANSVNLFCSLLIFTISLIGMFKTKIPVGVFIICGIVIAYFI